MILLLGIYDTSGKARTLTLLQSLAISIATGQLGFDGTATSTLTLVTQATLSLEATNMSIVDLFLRP